MMHAVFFQSADSVLLDSVLLNSVLLIHHLKRS
jgi:hypothetical protein